MPDNYPPVYGYKSLTAGDELELMYYVATIGPIAVAIEVSGPFGSYSSGIYYYPNCTMSLNHAVTIVGYGSYGPGQDYWIVRNSWGADWGDNGHILMARNKNNNCGIAQGTNFPILLSKPNPGKLTKKMSHRFKNFQLSRELFSISFIFETDYNTNFKKKKKSCCL